MESPLNFLVVGFERNIHEANKNFSLRADGASAVGVSPHPTFGHPPQIRKGDCTDYRVYAHRIWRGKRRAKMNNGLGHPIPETVFIPRY